MDIIDHIYEINPEALILDGFDNAIIGLSERINLGPVVTYDVEKIIETLCSRDEMTYEEAYEYYEFNIKGAWMGENTPVYLEVYNPEEYLVNSETTEREVVKVDMDNNEFDFTSKGPWEIDGHQYIFIEDKPSHDCDGECHNVIIKRTTDNKFFSYDWWWHPSSGDYIFEEEQLIEVFKKTTITVEYK
jgi:hypothetical protein